MQLNFSVKYDDGRKAFDGLDMYWGAKSLTGVAQALLISIHSFVHKEIILKAPAAKGFRVVLGRSYSGSWDQMLSLVITDTQTLSLVNDLGKAALYDLLKWGLLSGVGVKYALQHRKSKKVIKELRTQVDDLQERLNATMKEVHLPIKNQGLTVHVMGGRTLLARYDEETLDYLETEIEKTEQVTKELAVSRFNTRTGWGRFIEEEDSLSIPFSPVYVLSKYQKAILADNLAKLAREKFETVTAVVSEVVSKEGVLKRYKLHGVTDV
jgi:preprotein translocase subunit SecD